MTQPITVLVVDNEPGFAELAGEMLERERDAIVTKTATGACEALECLEKQPIDCIVSDYEMPTLTGLELLDRVRESDPELPFILFTGRGSEAVASEAIAAGVTQYLQKDSGSDQYAVLANQITNAVSQYRTETALHESKRRYQRTVTALHEATRDLMRAGTKAEIYEVAVETASDILDVSVAAAYAFEPGEGRLESAAVSAKSDGIIDPDESITREDGNLWSVFSEGESAYYKHVSQDAGALNATPPNQSELLVPLGTHGMLVAGTKTVDGFDETMQELFHTLAANTEAALDRAEREQLLREHDRTLTRQNEELTQLNHTNEIVREITHGVTQASTRSEIETTVCDRLADTERYCFAWIADSNDPMEPTAWAGVDTAFIDRVRDDGDRTPEFELIDETLEDGDVRVVRNVLEEEGWSQRRKEALTYGYQTVLAVALTDMDRHYGVLLVHVKGADSVGEREQDVLGELGETIGHAIRSVERTHAMVTDNRLEIEVACHDSRLLLNRVAKRVNGAITVEGVISRESDSYVVFVSAPTSTLPSVAQWASIETVSVVSEGDEQTLFELTVTSSPILNVLRTYDVHLQRATAADGTTTLALEVSQQVQTRSLVEAIQDHYADVELEARRETTTRSVRQIETHLEERLTTKQFEALQAAHYSGFFEWPRDSTGEDLAAALDISSPTYQYHLRAAERKLVSLVFDGSSR
ncbi:GAF domain-containing protein [Natronorubrum sediminis]|uniref:GAF domain-containing protein n=1 Tax=Natronorubrum sediminis TaxID=640943 RepID=A0A1H6G2R1_9EURY|nr:bacterio-opsin activator domain-containing protein [Natronorubrum sediminis]SEH16900.1 GAF domain-containing protein [Natronorubrum sediminis]